MGKQKPAEMQQLSTRQRRRLAAAGIVYVLIFAVYLTAAAAVLIHDRRAEERSWVTAVTVDADTAARVKALSADAVHVQAGTYVESLPQLSLHDSSFSINMLVWFRWNGDAALDPAGHFHIYKGVLDEKTLVKETHENGVNYQLLRVRATVEKVFWTRRFPLDSHQLRCYIEMERPVQQVVLDADTRNSGINTALSLAGYRVTAAQVAPYFTAYDSTHDDPDLSEPYVSSELVTQIAIVREGAGMYVKCFIALWGSVCWTLIALFINAYHKVDPLEMLPGALFGAVSNVMVGASLLPDALEAGLLEYGNIFGILIILLSTVSVIAVNRQRSPDGGLPNEAYARICGRMSLGIIAIFTLAGNLLLPLAAWAL